MPPTYYAIFTTLGLQRLAEAQYTGVPVEFTHLAVGDGNGSGITPGAGMTALVHETARVSVNRVTITPSEPTTVRVEGLIPAATGGFTIREAGLFNEDGELLVIATYPSIYKPTPADGVTADEYIRILLVYEAVESIALSIDPAVIMATREYVDEAIEEVTDRVEYCEGAVLLADLGAGSDGDADLNGTNTVAWASKVGSTYTLTRTPECTNLIVRAGTTVKVANFPILSQGDVETEAGAIIHADGLPGTATGSGTGGAGGVATTGGSIGGGFDGGAGGNATANGNAGTNATASKGGAGGKGGSSTTGGTAGSLYKTGGAGGTKTAPAATTGILGSWLGLIAGHLIGAGALTKIRGGAGGGGGGAGTGIGGAGGGAGAGVIAIGCRRLVHNGTIRAAGGAGANGVLDSGGGTGGGGGGAGGRIGVIAGQVTGSGTITAPGGVAGVAGAVVFADSNDPADGAAGEVTVVEAVAAQAGPHPEEGLAIFVAADEVDITFPAAWAYANATGLDGYKLEIFPPYLSDPDVYGGITVWIEDKTTTGFKIRASDLFNGEVRWKALGN